MRALLRACLPVDATEAAVLTSCSFVLDTREDGPMVNGGFAESLGRIVRCVLSIAAMGGRHVRLGLRKRCLLNNKVDWVVFVEGSSFETRPQISLGSIAPDDVGLASAAQQVEAWGGLLSVQLQGVANDGIVVWFSLPDLCFGLLESTETNEATFRGLRVLVVDDNRVNLAVLEGLLDRKGCRVEVAEDGRAATTILARGDFDIVLMDLHMPIMDGFEATRWIRGQGGVLRDIPIVAVTANVLPSGRARCEAAGMDAYVSKPVSSEKLLATMEKVLRRRSASLRSR